jgi:hypothetical protein
VQLDAYLDEIREQFGAAADAGGEDARALADRLIAPLDSAVRLALQHALADAADEITIELAPGSVELRVRGRELGFVVTAPPVDATDDEPDAPPPDALPEDDGEMARINVRMPDHLKARVERAARAQQVSVNAWLVRAATVAVERADGPSPHAEWQGRRGAQQRYRGWAK